LLFLFLFFFFFCCFAFLLFSSKRLGSTRQEKTKKQKKTKQRKKRKNKIKEKENEEEGRERTRRRGPGRKTKRENEDAPKRRSKKKMDPCEAVARALEDAGPVFIERVCGRVEYGEALRGLVRRTKTYAALAGAVETDDPIEVHALRGIDRRTIALTFVAPFFAAEAEREVGDLLEDEFAEYASRRIVVSRARNARERAAETLIDCMTEHVSDEYFVLEFGASAARFKKQAAAYAGEELTRSVFSACRTMDGILALVQSDEACFEPLEEHLGTMDATERVVVPVLAAFIGTDRASVLRSLFVRMAFASPSPLGPWCSEWTRFLTGSDVVRLAPRLVALGLAAAVRNVRDARTLVLEGLALDDSTRPRLVPDDVARVARKLTPRAIDLLAREPRHAPTIIRVFSHDALVLRRACETSTDLPGAVSVIRKARDRRAVSALARAISRIAIGSTDEELISSLRACGDGVVHALNALDQPAFDRAMRAMRRFRPKGLCHYILATDQGRIGRGISLERGTALFEACFDTMSLV
jgi:hypothetical protein